MCPSEPSVDLNVLKSKGYYGFEGYIRGFFSPHGLKQMGWTGNKSEDVMNVVKELSLLGSVNNCALGFFCLKMALSNKL